MADFRLLRPPSLEGLVGALWCPFTPNFGPIHTAQFCRAGKPPAAPNMEPRIAIPKGGRAERIVYTEADGKSQIIAVVVLGPSTFKNTKYIRAITHILTGERWKSIFDSTIRIYGIGILAVLTALMEEGRNWQTDRLPSTSTATHCWR